MITFVCSILTRVLLLSTFTDAASVAFQVKQAPELDALFAIHGNGGSDVWMGGDADTSVPLVGSPLGEGIVLWLFGDTFIGKYNDTTQQRLGGWRMPHSTVALQRGDSRPSFHWKVDSSGVAVTLFTPSDTTAAYNYWVVSGLYVPPIGTFSDKLFLLATRYTSNPLTVLGTTAIVVDNPSEDPSRWNYRTSDLPASFAAGGVKLWQSTIVKDPSAPNVAYIVGHGAQSQVLARAEISDLLAFAWGTVEFWSAGSVWLSKADDLQPLYSGGSNGITMQYHESLKQWFTLTNTMMGKSVDIHMAPKPTGPWTKQPFFVVPSPFDAKPYRTYHIKSHPNLASGSDIVVSFVNQCTPQCLFDPGEGRTYVPHFMRAKIISEGNITFV